MFDPVAQKWPKNRATPASILRKGTGYDERYVKCRPTIVVGGGIDPADAGPEIQPDRQVLRSAVADEGQRWIFTIDDFGRQQVRPMDLLNRWIVPLKNGTTI